MRNNKISVRRNRNSFLARARRGWRRDRNFFIISFLVMAWCLFAGLMAVNGMVS